MENRKKELKEIYSQWSTEKLEETLKKNRADYEEIAIVAMKEELKRREEMDKEVVEKVVVEKMDKEADKELGDTITPITSTPDIQPKKKSLKLKANKKIAAEQLCNLCNDKFLIGDDIEKCEKCGVYYHQRCWNENHGCIKPGCREDIKKCPMCGETIKAAALKCRYCGEYLDKSVKVDKTPKGTVKEATDALKYSLFGLICFGIILGPVAIYKGTQALKIIQEEPGYEGKGRAIAGIIIGTFDTLAHILIIISRFSTM